MINKILLFCVAFILSNAYTIAQEFQININDINLGESIQRQSLLNYDIINYKGTPEDVLIVGELRLRNSREYIKYEASIRLDAGLNIMKNKLSLVQLTYSSIYIKQCLENYHLLPVDIYEYCVVVKQKHQSESQDGGVIIAQDCIIESNDNAFLLELNTPYDKEVLDTKYPNLSWIANSPILSRLTYNLKVTEVKKGQSNIDAIQRNRQHFIEKRNQNLSIQYPVSARELDTNKYYAWNVEAYFGPLLMGKAEPWSFIIKDTLSPPEYLPPNLSYYDLDMVRQHTTIQVRDTLKLKYKNFGDTANVNYTIVDEIKSDTIATDLFWKSNSFINYIDLDLQPIKLKHKRKYIIHFTINNTQYNIPFIYYKTQQLDY